MTIEKLKQYEPFFGNWYVTAKVAEGKSSKIFKSERTLNGEAEYMGLKVLKFPSGDRELSRIIESGLYQNVDEYLEELQEKVCGNVRRMLNLKHNKNIVKIEDYMLIRESSCFYVVMLTELLTPLSDHLKADRVDSDEVIKIGCDLCKALDGFRNEGIMHRNIKPDNIYVDADGNYKLGDFGISESGITELVPGGYTAPELLGDIDYDYSSDIYSLGVVLYKLLNNNRGPFLPPFPTPISYNDRETANIRRLRGDLFPAPSNADYSLARIIFKATAFKPEDRYDSPFLLMQELADYLQSEAVLPPAPAPVKTRHVGTEKIRTSRTDGAQSVTEADKDDFEEAFTDSDEDYEDEPSNKKWYFIIMALVIVLALIIGLIVKSKSDKADETTTEITTTVQSTTEQTTTEPTTQPSTTEETTTEETTTEETTTETTTEETTTEPTTTETTTEETTTETTTEETTTAPTQPADTTEPILAGSVNTEGSQNELGKYYISLNNCMLLQDLGSSGGDKIVLEISDELGEMPQIKGKVYIYEYYGNTRTQKITPAASLVPGDNNTYLLNITVYDEDFYYQPSSYRYYLCLEEGAIESDTAVALPLQITL